MHPIDKTFGGVHTGAVHCAGPEHLPARFSNYRPGQSLPKLQAIVAVEESWLQSISWPQAMPFVKLRHAVCRGQLLVQQCLPRHRAKQATPTAVQKRWSE